MVRIEYMVDINMSYIINKKKIQNVDGTLNVTNSCFPNPCAIGSVTHFQNPSLLSVNIQQLLNEKGKMSNAERHHSSLSLVSTLSARSIELALVIVTITLPFSLIHCLNHSKQCMSKHDQSQSTIASDRGDHVKTRCLERTAVVQMSLNSVLK